MFESPGERPHSTHPSFPCARASLQVSNERGWVIMQRHTGAGDIGERQVSSFARAVSGGRRPTDSGAGPMILAAWGACPRDYPRLPYPILTIATDVATDFIDVDFVDALVGH